MYRTQRCWELLAALGNHVREARRHRGLDQYDLAEALGIHRATVSKIESGKHWPGAALFERLADYLGVEPPKLFELPRQVRLPTRDAFVRERETVEANGFRLELRKLIGRTLVQIDSPAAQACAVVIAGRAAMIHAGGREELASSEVLFFTPGAEPVYAHAADQRGAALLVVTYGAARESLNGNADGNNGDADEGAAITAAASW